MPVACSRLDLRSPEPSFRVASVRHKSFQVHELQRVTLAGSALGRVAAADRSGARVGRKSFISKEVMT